MDVPTLTEVHIVCETHQSSNIHTLYRKQKPSNATPIHAAYRNVIKTKKSNNPMQWREIVGGVVIGFVAVWRTRNAKQAMQCACAPMYGGRLRDNLPYTRAPLDGERATHGNGTAYGHRLTSIHVFDFTCKLNDASSGVVVHETPCYLVYRQAFCLSILYTLRALSQCFSTCTYCAF